MRSPFFALLLLLVQVVTVRSQVNITMWQADLQHTGQNLNETVLTPALVSSAGNFGLLFAQATDGQIYGQPLYVSGLNIGGTLHNVVYAVTQHASIYAFDADDNTGANANPLWKKSLLPSGAIPPPQSEVGSGDISVELGITATPVIDLASQTIYVLAKFKITSTSTYQQRLHALDLKTGAEKFNGPIIVNPAFPGSSTDAVNGIIPFNPLRSHARCALLLYNGIVYLSYASHSDSTPYHGEIAGYDAATLQLVKTFNASPNGMKNGIWQGGASPAVDSFGNMYVATGNGPFDQTPSQYTTGTNWGMSFLKLPTTGAFAVSYSNPLNWFTPSDWPELNFGDLDLGSSGLLLLPDQSGGTHPRLMVGGGKGGNLYVIDRDNMGGLNTPNRSVQEITETNSLFVTPAYHKGYIYYAPSGSKMTQRAVGYNPVDGTYISTTAIRSNFTYAGGHGAHAFISANGNQNGIVWCLDLGTPARLHAYNATNVSGNPIYSGSATLPGNINCSGRKFTIPIVANGKVYFTADADNKGRVFVFGRPPPVAGTPTAPSNLLATAITSGAVRLTWNDNSNNELSFKVKRSTTFAGPFTALSPNSNANETSFTDSGLNPSTTYYYQVVAANANGESNPTPVASATTFPYYAPSGLIGYWNFDEGSGGTAADSTGNGRNGSLNGEIAWDTGFVNNAISFHGTGAAVSNIAVPNSSAFQFAANQSFTLAAWVYPSALRGSPEAVIAKSRDQGNYYGIWINAANQWAFSGSTGEVVGGPVVQSSWSHVAVVQDGTAGTRKIYINGTLSGSGAAQAADGNGPLWIGQAKLSSGVATDSFPGSIDEVILYNRALQSSEIGRLLSPPVLQSESSQTHGVAGSFGQLLTPTLTRVMEARKGVTVGTYRLVLSFSAPVSGIQASLLLQDGGTAVGNVGSIAYDSTGRIVTVTLNGVGNAQGLHLHLNSILPGNGTAVIPFNVLWGDVNRDGAVDYLDLNIAQWNHGVTLTSVTSQYDINCDGAISAADDALVSVTMGTQLGLRTSTNLALHRPSLSSSAVGVNTSAPAFDGNVTTRWESNAGDPQWISVDLGSVSSIESVALNWENAAGRTYTIQFSNDNINWTTPVSESNNPGAGIRSYSLPANTTARYVRLNGTSRTTIYGYSLWEFEVYGVPGSNSGPMPAITSALSAGGTAASSFSYQITGTNGPTSFHATGLPAGLAINHATGAITGVPASAGTSQVTISAINENGAGSATLNLTIDPVATTPPVVTSPGAASAVILSPFSYQITATNGPTSFAAIGLPEGLTIDGTTGLISGSPNTSGTVNISLTATNSIGTSAVKTLILTVDGGGNVNLALTGTATTTSSTGGNTAPKAIDGSSSTRWESQYSDPQSITVDLGDLCTIRFIILNWQNAAGKTYTLQVSSDNSSWSNIASESNNTSAGTKTYSNLNSVGRFVRMSGTARTTQYGYSLFEFQIWGVTGTNGGGSAPVITSPLTASGTVNSSFSYQIVASNSPTSYGAGNLSAGLTLNSATGLISGTPTSSGTTNVAISATNSSGTDAKTLAVTIDAVATSNLALNRDATASSFQAGNLVSNANDANTTGTRWAAADGTYPQWWRVDLGTNKTLSKVDIKWFSSATRSYRYKIEVSSNDTAYTTVVDKSANAAFGDTSDTFTATAKYLRVTVLGASAGFASFFDIAVFGSDIPATPSVTGIVSRQTHGSTGFLDLSIPISGPPPVEPRRKTDAGDYLLVVTFANGVSGITGNLGLQTGQSGTAIGTAGAITYGASGTQVSIALNGVGNAQHLNLRLTGIQPGNGTVDIPINILCGDVNGDGTVNVLDLGQVRTRSGQPVDSTTFRYDINCDGAINVLDIGTTRLKSGTTLP